MSKILNISSGQLSAVVQPLGATLIGVYLSAQKHNLILGFADLEDHARIPVYAGAIVGPVANRVRHGRAPIDGTSYQMPLNEGRRATLHSGSEGLHAWQWTVSERADDAVKLCCTLPDGACGLPGRREVKVTYRVAQTTLSVEITATTDQPTPMNIAAHPYWNLDGTPTLENHRLQISAESYTPTGPDLLPTGQINTVAGTAFDFRIPRDVPLTPALDINYCLGITPGPTPRRAAILTGATGCRLALATTAPGLQVYNGAHLPHMDKALTEGRNLRPYGGIALEPQHWPDALHHPHFPNVILTPDRPYHQHSTYSLTPAKGDA